MAVFTPTFVWNAIVLQNVLTLTYVFITCALRTKQICNQAFCFCLVSKSMGIHNQTRKEEPAYRLHYGIIENNRPGMVLALGVRG